MVRLFWVKFLVLQSLTFEVSKVDKLFAICIKGALYDCSHIDPTSLHCVQTKFWFDYTAYIVCIQSAGLTIQPTSCCLKSAGLTTQPRLCA